MVTTRNIRKIVVGESDKESQLFQYAWYLKKQGYAESTIRSREAIIRVMLNQKVSLGDSESVKAFIANQKQWSQGRKRNAVHAYTNYLTSVGKTWDSPRYLSVSKPIWLPYESEINQLIGGLSPRYSAFCQLLRETGARPIEAFNLTWEDIDPIRKTVNITPAKQGNPRTLKLSSNLLAMINKIRTKNKYIFKTCILKHYSDGFREQRTNIAAKLENPRINKISFKTFRHWKGTKLYSDTKDILLVKYTLGHKSIKNTMVYTHLVDFGEEEFVTKVAKNTDEACMLLETGFQYVLTTPEDHMIFKKRK